MSVEAIEQLIRTIDAQELDIEIWIPEPVIWEWAEHAHRVATQAQTDYLTQVKHLAVSVIPGFEGGPAFVMDVADVIEHIEEQLDDLWRDDGSGAVRILRLKDQPDAAILGLRDQILRTGAGRTKRDGTSAVKTGGADSASWRLVAATSGDLVNVVLVSSDSDAYRHFSGTDAPTIVKDLWSVKRELLKLRSGTDEAVLAVTETLRDELPAISEDHLDVTEVLGEHLLLTPQRDQAVISITRISRVLDVDEIEVSLGDKTATAVVEIEIDVSIDYVRWDHRNDSIEADVDEEYDVKAYARVSAEAVAAVQGRWFFDIVQIEIVDDRYNRP